MMNRIDPDMGELVSQAVRDIGVELHLEEKVEAIEGGDRVRAVRTAARTLEADLVVLGLGTSRPSAWPRRRASSSARAAPSPSTPACAPPTRVWAAGDCAESRHLVSGKPVSYHLGTIANKQGRVCGINIGGGYATFPGVLGTAVSKVCEVEVARTGLSEAELGELGLEWERASVDSTTRAGYFPGRPRSGPRCWPSAARAACWAPRSSARRARPSGSTCSPPPSGTAWPSTRWSTSTCRTRRRSRRSGTRC